MLLELQHKDLEKTYRERYFDNLKHRLVDSSLELEGVFDSLAGAQNAIKIDNQSKAINYMFDREEEPLMTANILSVLCKVAAKVSGGEITDFRTTMAHVNGSKVIRSNPRMIRNDLYHCFDDYNFMIQNVKSIQDLYEIEAIFHIRLLHIHPFEDANGRTARILLAYNMANNNLAPAVISKKDKRLYCDCIEHNDYNALAQLFEELSKQELEIMLYIYKELDQKGLIETNKMTDKQQKKYYKCLKKARLHKYDRI